jgi:hypothetical protein
MTRSISKDRPTRIHLRNLILILVCLALLMPLAAYIWSGSLMRYSGDDYCYGSELNKRGFLQNQVYSYQHPMRYNGNRYSATLFSNLGDLLGPASGAVMPGLAIILWVAGSFLMIRKLGKLLRLEIGRLTGLVFAEFFVLMCIYLAPYLMQDLFWRSAMLTYLAPVICLTWLVWLVLVYCEHEQGGLVVLSGIALLAFISAGFSETGAALQAATFIFALFGFIYFIRENQSRRRRGIVTTVFVLSISLAAMAVLAFSPSNVERISTYPLTDPIRLVTLSLNHGLTFIIESLSSYPLPTVVILAFSIALAFLISENIPVAEHALRKRLITAGLISIACYLAIVATAAPSVLARGIYPEQRAWMPGRAAMTTGLFLVGICLGLILKTGIKIKSQVRSAVIALILLATGVYALRITPRILADAQPMQSWSAAWDTRHQEIKSMILAGETDLMVQNLPMIIPWVAELGPDPLAWYNACAAGWYEVTSITAVEKP